MRTRIVCIVAISALSLLAGCTVYHANRFRVIDAVNGRPIAGVRAEGTGTFPTSWNHVQRFGPAHATSDADGIVDFADERGPITDDVTFEKEGYQSCAVVADWPGYRKRFHVWPLRSFPWEDDDTAVIALQPQTGK